MNKIDSNLNRGPRRVAGFGGAAALVALALLLFLRPDGKAWRPEPKRGGAVRGEEAPALPAPAPQVSAQEIPVPLDPLESTRKVPVLVKSPPKPGTLAATSTPIAATLGSGPDRFAIRDRNVNAFFTNQGVTLAILQNQQGKNATGHSLNWGLDGAAPVEPKPQGELPTRINRLVGDSSRWQTNLPSYSSVLYEEVKPGVDVLVESQPHALKYTVQLAPGADPESLHFHFEGADVLVSDDAKSLQVVTGVGVMQEKDLHCWQEGPAGRIPATAHYARTGPGGYAIVLDQYDPNLPLTVDPQYSWATFLGGTLSPSGGDDYGYAVFADGSYNSYVAGYTYSADFPTTAGAYQTTHAVTADGYIGKFSPTGTLIWSTLLGGNSGDFPQAIGLDSSGNVVVAGYTSSSNFPTTAGAFQTTNPTGNTMGFVTKLNATGTALVWSTYLGGSDNSNYIYALAIDGGNNVVVTGNTYATTFPLKNPGQSTLAGSADVFVTKLLPDGSAPAFSSYLGGTDYDYGAAIAVDTTSNIYIGGYTYSPGSSFPTTAGAFSRVNQGQYDCFVTKVTGAGVMVWSTLIGGASYDFLTGLCLDNASPPNVIITGYTYKSSSSLTDFPVTGGAFQTAHSTGYDGFVTKINQGGNSLIWSTYLGGTGDDFPTGICTYPGAEIYLAGYTSSTNFPITAASAYHTTNLTGGGYTGFVTRLSFGGAMGWSTYMGGSNYDYIYAIAQSGGWVFLTGNTGSANYPTSAGVWKTTLSGSSDSFITRMNPYNSGASSLVFSSYFGGTHGQGSTQMSGYFFPATGCVALDDSGNTYVAATTDEIDYPAVAGHFQASLRGTNNNIVVSKIADNGAAPLVWSTYLGGANNYQYVNGLAISSVGSVYLTGYTGATDFPTVPGSYRTILSGGEDAFVTCINPDGNSLAFSTFLGGSTSSDYGIAIALDSSNNVYVAGISYSTDFPTTPGVVKLSNGGSNSDGFVTKLNPTGTTLLYSTLFGGNLSYETITALAVDSTGAAYVTGWTGSTDFPITGGAYSSTFNTTNGNTAFVTKLTPTASAYAYSTFFGGTSGDYPYALAVDGTGQCFVGGYTYSSNFPVVAGCYQTVFGGSTDGFVTKFTPAGSAIGWSTFLGGSDYDYLFGMALDANNNVYVTGYTSSSDFPMTPPLLNSTYRGNTDAFATRINAGGLTLSWSTYLGGTNTDYGSSIAVNALHNVCVAGFTYSSDFLTSSVPPSTPGLQTTMNGQSDLFLVRINNEPPSVPSGLAQYRSDGVTVIPTGGATNETTVILKGLSGDPEGDKYNLQVEVEDVGTALVEPATIATFTGPYFESALTKAGNTATVTVTGRTAGTHYHWAARSVDIAGVASAWVSYGGNTENPPTNPAAIDFQVDQTPPTIAIGSPISSGTYYTNLTTVALSGTSSDNVQVFNVTWSNSANATN
ncbi:MAG TPA: SBBP repeat-containing protein, partial [Planctomycetota bacterium]|nr:SBBP repeat-containing protein [Planctomycetota bacterium]